MEIWKFIPATNNLYEVSNLGNIKRVPSLVPNNINGGQRKVGGQLLSQKTKSNQYKEVCLYIKPNISTMMYVHRAVASAFIGEIPEGFVINHKNGVKSNNNLENLEIVTYSQNSKHAFDTGLSINPIFKGSKHGMAKLTEDVVLKIRDFHNQHKSIDAVINQFSISRGTAANVCYRNTWKHI